MIEYIIKSTISLTVLYILYYFLLRNTKSFEFNRFFLLFMVIFSLIMPLIHISLSIHLMINQNIQEYSESSSINNLQGAIENGQESNIVNLFDLIPIIYILISTIFLIRFIINLWKINKLIKSSSQDKNRFPGVVLTENKTLPYSFFQHIIVNKTEYEQGQIDNELIIHEQAHCEQHHSIDVLFIEIIKIFFWFNPIIWILKKEIQLNHEYLADNKVLQTQNLKTYQEILLNLVFRNNSTYLASNFNYSLTKKRLIMMTKNNSLVTTIVRKIAIVPLVFLLTVTLTFSQKTISSDSLFNFESEWWYPILEKHKIELLSFNNFQDVFEMGTSNSINNRIVTLTDALFIIRENDGYRILKSPLAYHDLDKNIISGDEGTMETYKYESDDTNPNEKLSYKNFEFVIHTDKKSTWRVENVKGVEY